MGEHAAWQPCTGAGTLWPLPCSAPEKQGPGHWIQRQPWLTSGGKCWALGALAQL